MAKIEHEVAAHYGSLGLYDDILAGLKRGGRLPEAVTIEDLAAVDEKHVGGRAATEDLAARIDAAAGAELLDLGCGLGGAARYFAQTKGLNVTGIDLTPAFVEAGRALTRLTGLEDRVRHVQGSVLDLPFEDRSFDAATLLHVGMNVADKARLFAQARRVLRPGGVLAVYDVMRTGAGDLAYPMPWAASEATSFPASPADYRAALAAAGFEVADERDRRAFGIDFFEQMQARAAAEGLPPKFANLLDGLRRGVVAPVEMICR